jgi:hypothetical protein
MARRTFFSFHYDRDIWRANVVRNSWVTKDREAAGFWDASLWEEAKIKGDESIKTMILDGLKNTSVTVVLIGAETANRQWINYEIIESYKCKNGLLGLYIHNIKDIYGHTDTKGNNPFDYLHIEKSLGTKTYLSSLYPCYDYVNDNGYLNLGDWINNAAQQAGR